MPPTLVLCGQKKKNWESRGLLSWWPWRWLAKVKERVGCQLWCECGKKSFILGGVTTRSGTFNLLTDWVGGWRGSTPLHRDRQSQRCDTKRLFTGIFPVGHRNSSSSGLIRHTSLTLNSHEGRVGDFGASPTTMGRVQLIRVFYGALGHE